MQTLFIGKTYIRLDAAASTNSHMADLITQMSKDALEGLVVSANEQSQGRGQRGTSWESEPGKNLSLSILLKPEFLKAEEQFQLNKAISLGVSDFVADTLAHFKVQAKVSIKWPNDIYVEDKKVAGILIENTVIRKSLQHAIVGIGINVNQKEFSEAIPNPVSLKAVTKSEIDLTQAAEQLFSTIEKRYLQLRAGKNIELNRAYLSKLFRYNEWSNFQYKHENIQARITGVSDTGKLQLETKSKKQLECELKEIAFV